MNKNNNNKGAFLVWLAIYPLITILFWLLGDYLSKYPLAVRPFILTALTVPVVSFLIVPFYNRVFTKWLNQ